MGKTIAEIKAFEKGKNMEMGFEMEAGFCEGLERILKQMKEDDKKAGIVDEWEEFLDSLDGEENEVVNELEI